MAATIFIEQDTGTWRGHAHGYNGYSSGFSTPLSDGLTTQHSVPALHARIAADVRSSSSTRAFD